MAEQLSAAVRKPKSRRHPVYNNDGGVKGIGERRRFWVLKKRHFALYGVLTFSRGPRLAH
jgi:hypothetical protein